MAKAYHISFGENIRQVPLEEMLHRHFAESLKHASVIFDFTRSRYFELFAQSLLFVWARRIVEAKRQLLITAPGTWAQQTKEPTDVLRFMTVWRVWDGYQQIGVKVDELSSGAPADDGGREPRVGRYYPFSFYGDEGEWDNFLKDLEDERKISSMFPDDTAQLAVIGQGGLRSIIMGEIGKNAFEHGKGIAAHVAIGRVNAFHADEGGTIAEKLAWRLEGAPGYATRFFQNLGNVPCLEIVMGDAGPGVPVKLRAAYGRDRILEKKKAKPSDADLIEYSQLLHSSSKRDSWYVVSGDSQRDYKPPRGLYFVKNIARRNRALLVCRSGAGYYVCDFLSSGSGEFHGKFFAPERWPLAPLGGAQIQLLIPKLPSGHTPARLDLVHVGGRAVENREIHVVPVARLLREAATFDARRIAQALTTGAHREVLRTGVDDLVIFDFIGTRWAKDTKDKLYPLICEFCHLALDGRIIGVAHTSHIDAVIDGFFSNARNEPDGDKTRNWARPFLHFSFHDGQVKIDLRGQAYQRISAEFRAMLEHGPQGKILEHLDHLLSANPGGASLLRFDPKAVTAFLIEYRAKLLDRIMSEPSYGIYHQGRFLLPTGPYVENFFEVAALLETDEGRELVREGLISLLYQGSAEGAIIVCLSPVGCEMGRLLENTALIRDRHLSLVYVPETHRLLDVEVPPGFRGQLILMVDVIVSGSSLGFALQFLSRKVGLEQITSLAIIDRRPDPLPRDQFHWGDQAIGLKSVFRKPSVLHAAKPPGWSYTEIQRIDDTKWRPIVEDEQRPELWSTREFLTEACVKGDAVRVGHFEGPKGAHYKHFILTRRIGASYGDLIVRKIKERVDAIMEKGRVASLSHILIPEGSIGIKEIATRYNQLHAGARLVLVDVETSRRAAMDSAGGKAALFLDSASSSNHTAFALLEAASRLRPAIVIGCVLMIRAPDTNWNVLSRVTGYSNSDVVIFALTQVRLPVYHSEDDCPLCKRMRYFRELKQSKKYPLLDAHLTRELSLLVKVPVESLTKNPTVFNAESTRTLADVAYFRAVLDQAASQGLGALEVVARILRGKTAQERRAREALIAACAYEASLLKTSRLKTPADIIKLFASGAEEVALTSGDLTIQRAALEVLSVVAPEGYVAVACRFAEKFAMEPRRIEMLLSEMLTRRLVDDSITAGQIAESLTAIYNHIEELKRRDLVDPSIRTLILSVRRGLEYEVHSVAASAAGFSANLDALVDMLTHRRGGTHPFIGQTMMMLGYIGDTTSAQKVLDHFYIKEGRFADQVFRELLPRLAAIESAIDAIDQDELGYLCEHNAESLRSDFYLFNTAILSLHDGISRGVLTDDDFRKIYYTGDVQRARTRLTVWLGKESARLLGVLRAMLCDVAPPLKDCCTFWRAATNQQGIGLDVDLGSGSVFCYVHPEIVMNVANNLLENTLKYAFPKGSGIKRPTVRVRLTETEEHGILEIADNGVGQAASAEVGLGRLRVLVEPFDGVAERILASTGVHLRVMWWKKRTKL